MATRPRGSGASPRELAREIMPELLQYVTVLIANEEDAHDVLDISAPGTDVDSGNDQDQQLCIGIAGCKLHDKGNTSEKHETRIRKSRLENIHQTYTTHSPLFVFFVLCFVFFCLFLCVFVFVVVVVFVLFPPVVQ